jgi:hypothetical protein
MGAVIGFCPHAWANRKKTNVSGRACRPRIVVACAMFTSVSLHPIAVGRRKSQYCSARSCLSHIPPKGFVLLLLRDARIVPICNASFSLARTKA